MRFTDIFIKRPVLAMTVSLLILVLGLRSLDTLSIRQYPRTENAVVTITTFYYGADAETVAGFITQPLESAIAQAQGIDYMTSSSLNGVSTITANLRLNYDANRALTEINTQVNSVLNQLPPETQQPTLKIDIGQTTDAMYLGFFSTVLPTNKITDYLLRVVKPKLDAVEGVQVAEILGGRQFALRAWLNADKMAAHNITGADVSAALVNNNFISALGSTKGQMVAVDLRASTNVHSLDEFKNLVIRNANGALIRLGDIATVALGAEDYNTNVAFSGKTSVFIGIKTAPEANVLDVIKRVKDVLPEIQRQMPEGLQSTIAYDTTKFITSSINEVVNTLVETLLIVTAVIFLFLGTFRAVAIPVIAMPLSLIGTFALMLALGYSINLLTLLALVLAIGLVVDDAIIVVENVDRHLKEGQTPIVAALAAARELAGPIIVISVVLVAVYVPVGFQGGLTGALFSEFAFTLAGAVGVSAVIALTLSPMMCSRMLRAHTGDNRLQKIADRTFEAIRGRYSRMLRYTLDTWPVMVVLGALILAANAYLFMNSSKELAPNEDQGIVLAQSLAAPNATIQQMGLYSKQAYDIFKSLPEFDASFQIDGMPSTNQALAGILFKPWDERGRTADVMQQELQAKLNTIAGARVAAFQFPPLPGARGLPFQFVINTTESFRNLDGVSQAVIAKAYQSGMFFYVDTDLKIDKPQATLVIDRDKAGALGMTMQDVGAALTASLGGGYVNYFSLAGRSYKVIPQVLQVDRLNPGQLDNYYIRTPKGDLIPASTVAHIEIAAEPESINRFQQLNSATISGVLAPGVTLGDAMEKLTAAVYEVAPTGYSIDSAGQLRQYVQESGGFVVTLVFAIIIVFLVLAAQFESFRDSIVILASVPMAAFGALLCVNAGFATMNIYTQVGLVTLIGLISKHGILIVQFANDLQREGKKKREAIEEAAAVRLRPILMTTAAMLLGVVPLVLASGAGAVGRNNMGLIIFSGIAVGTLFTLFVVPAMYMLLAVQHRARTGEEPGNGHALTVTGNNPPPAPTTPSA